MPFPRMIYRLMMLLAITFILGQFLPIQQATAKENNPSSTTVANTIYLPSLSNPNNSIFGSYLYPVNNSRGLDKISDARLNWTRIELNWKTIEPIYGNIDWKLAAGFDATISTALNAGLNPIVIIGDTPAWALKPGFSCGPIRQDYFPEFARFVTQAVQRYSSPPYNVYHYEMYNEPDAHGFLGCWGDPADTSYYGGSYYGLMLQSIYPAAKSANPQSKILFGGLLLDCDPTNPPTGKTCIPAKFLEGALQNGAANSFDGVAFHSYDYYQSFGNYSNPNWNSSRTATGPAFLSKAAYLRGVLQRYGISNKPLYMTEFALFDGGSGQNPSTPLVEATKSFFVIHVMASSLADNYKTAIWHEAVGDRNNSLFEQPSLSPYPVYNTYAFANKLLANAVYSRKVANPDFVIHEFNKAGKKIWILWTVDNQEHLLNLPSPPLAVDRIGNDGNPISEAPALSIALDFAPAMIQFGP